MKWNVNNNSDNGGLFQVSFMMLSNNLMNLINQVGDCASVILHCCSFHSRRFCILVCKDEFIVDGITLTACGINVRPLLFSR